MKRTVNRLAGILLATLTVAAFARCWNYGLINLDDYAYIVHYPAVTRFSGWDSMRWCFTDVSEGIWMPLTWLSFALDHWLFGTWYGGYHLHSVLIHAVNAVLVIQLLRSLLPRDEKDVATVCCVLAGLAWAIHPLRCESVVFLSSRKDVLSFFWELLALIAWVKGCDEGRGIRDEGWGKRVGWTAAAVIFFVIGAMCKPSVMTFPLLCLLLDVFIVRRIRPLRYVVPFVLMVGIGGFASWQQSCGGATAYGAGEPLWARLAVAAAGFGIYLRNTVWPCELALQCIQRWPQWPRFLIPGVILSGLWGGYLLKRYFDYFARRREIVSVGWYDGCPVRLSLDMAADYVVAGMSWFALAVGPMLGIMVFGYHAFADRFTYIPSFGLALILAVALRHAAMRFGRAATYVPMVCIIAALGGLTWRQTGFWKNDETIFTHTVEIDGDRNDMAHRNIAMYSFEVTHDLEKARHHFDMARKVGNWALLNTLDVYVMTLVELGCEEEIPTAMREVEAAIIHKYGEDKARAILNKRPGLSKTEAGIAITYRFAQVASMLGKKPQIEAAKRELEGLSDGLENSTIWQYLVWRCLTLSGEKEAAKAMLERLLDPATKDDFMQFRYLRKAKGEGK